jgi:hypothetical protein
MDQLGKVIIGVASGLVAMIGIGWAGLQVSPSNLPSPVDVPQDLGTVEVPPDLPAPVRRYFQAVLGDQAPRIESLVVCGRARANFGFWLPLRYRLVHRPGYEFERYMEVTWFGLPVLKAIDRYVDGVGMTGPVGKAAIGPAIDQGANMVLWAEAPLMPSLWLTDSRIRWEAIDDTTARLFFPFGEEEDELMVYFDPESGLVAWMSALRYRDEQSGKIPWRVDFTSWQTINGVKLPARITVTWEDQGKPWSYWDFEGIYWNVDISKTLVTAVTDEVE